MKRLIAAAALAAISFGAQAAAYVGSNGVGASSASDPFWLFFVRLFGG